MLLRRGCAKTGKRTIQRRYYSASTQWGAPIAFLPDDNTTSDYRRENRTRLNVLAERLALMDTRINAHRKQLKEVLHGAVDAIDSYGRLPQAEWTIDSGANVEVRIAPEIINIFTSVSNFLKQESERPGASQNDFADLLREYLKKIFASIDLYELTAAQILEIGKGMIYMTAKGEAPFNEAAAAFWDIFEERYNALLTPHQAPTCSFARSKQNDILGSSLNNSHISEILQVQASSGFISQNILDGYLTYACHRSDAISEQEISSLAVLLAEYRYFDERFVLHLCKNYLPQRLPHLNYKTIVHIAELFSSFEIEVSDYTEDPDFDHLPPDSNCDETKMTLNYTLVNQMAEEMARWLPRIRGTYVCRAIRALLFLDPNSHKLMLPLFKKIPFSLGRNSTYQVETLCDTAVAILTTPDCGRRGIDYLIQAIIRRSEELASLIPLVDVIRATRIAGVYSPALYEAGARLAKQTDCVRAEVLYLREAVIAGHGPAKQLSSLAEWMSLAVDDPESEQFWFLKNFTPTELAALLFLVAHFDAPEELLEKHINIIQRLLCQPDTLRINWSNVSRSYFEKAWRRTLQVLYNDGKEACQAGTSFEKINTANGVYILRSRIPAISKECPLPGRAFRYLTGNDICCCLAALRLSPVTVISGQWQEVLNDWVFQNGSSFRPHQLTPLLTDLLMLEMASKEVLEALDSIVLQRIPEVPDTDVVNLFLAVSISFIKHGMFLRSIETLARRLSSTILLTNAEANLVHGANLQLLMELLERFSYETTTAHSGFFANSPDLQSLHSLITESPSWDDYRNIKLPEYCSTTHQRLRTILSESQLHAKYDVACGPVSIPALLSPQQSAHLNSADSVILASENNSTPNYAIALFPADPIFTKRSKMLLPDRVREMYLSWNGIRVGFVDCCET